MRICRELMGLKGSQHEAIRMLKALPKLEDATILMYLMLCDVSLASFRSNPGQAKKGRAIRTCFHE